MSNRGVRIASIFSVVLGLLGLTSCQKKSVATDAPATASKISSKVPTWAERYPRQTARKKKYVALNSITYMVDDLEIGQLVKVPFWPGFDEGEPWACGINVTRVQRGAEFDWEQQQAAQQVSQEEFTTDYWLAADIIFENLGYTETITPQVGWSARLLPPVNDNGAVISNDSIELIPHVLMSPEKLPFRETTKFTNLLQSSEPIKSGQFLRLSFNEQFMMNALVLEHRL
ncbi:hypothetical protein [Lapidilactobacillus wuchangensis]|uniref:hypothetical protein n=1 Tax=Lapidilactobacillus wuchangensis TaxID=2486001 RepID=UPI000F7960FE|nr:hypothetical protein [Lapidilactobacillus wuchangensis]